MYLVGQVSKMTNVSIRTLHYYDEIGLLEPTVKSDTKYRYYTTDDLVILQQIIVLKRLGFKLSQIKEMLQVNKNKSKKAEKWKQVFEMEIEKIQQEKKWLDQIEQCLHAILHSLELTGDVTTEYILDIIQSVYAEDSDSFLHRHFTEEEQSILLKKMPNLMTHNDRTRRWMELLKKVHETKAEPVESAASQALAEEIMHFVEQVLQIDFPLIDKYWAKIKPDYGQTEKVLGLDKETIDYIDNIMDYYEGNRKGVDNYGEQN